MRKRTRNSRRDGSEATVKISRIRKDLENEFPGFVKSASSRKAYRARVTAEDSNGAAENVEINTVGAESSEKETILSSFRRASGRGRGSIGNRGTTRAASRTRRRTVDTTKASAIGAESPKKETVLPSSRRNYQRGRGSSSKRGTTRAAPRTSKRTSDTAMTDAIGDMNTEKKVVPSSSRRGSGRARGSINNRGTTRTVHTTSRRTTGITEANAIDTGSAEKEMASSSSRAACKRGRGSASNRGTTRAAPRTSKRTAETTKASTIEAVCAEKDMVPESSMKKSNRRGGRRPGRPRVSNQPLVNNDDEGLAISPRRSAVSAIEKSTQGKKGRTLRKAAEPSGTSFVEKGDAPEKGPIRCKTTPKAAEPSGTSSVGSGDALEKKPVRGRKIRRAAVPRRRSSIEGGDTLEEELRRDRKTRKAVKSSRTSSVGNEDTLEKEHIRGKKTRKGAEPRRTSSLEGGDTLEKELVRGTKAKSADEEVKKISRSKALIEDQKWRKMDNSSLQDERERLPPRGKRKCKQRTNVKSNRARQGVRRQSEEVVMNEGSFVKDNIDSTTIDITVLGNFDLSPIVDSSVFWRIFVRGQVFLGRWMILDETPSFRRGVVAYLVVENSEAAYEGVLLAQLADSPLGRLPEEVYFVQLQSERNRSAMFQTVVDARFVEKTSDSPKFFYAVMLLRKSVSLLDLWVGYPEPQFETRTKKSWSPGTVGRLASDMLAIIEMVYDSGYTFCDIELSHFHLDVDTRRVYLNSACQVFKSTEQVDLTGENAQQVIRNYWRGRPDYAPLSWHKRGEQCAVRVSDCAEALFYIILDLMGLATWRGLENERIRHEKETLDVSKLLPPLAEFRNIVFRAQELSELISRGDDCGIMFQDGYMLLQGKRGGATSSVLDFRKLFAKLRALYEIFGGVSNYDVPFDFEDVADIGYCGSDQARIIDLLKEVHRLNDKISFLKADKEALMMRVEYVRRNAAQSRRERSTIAMLSNASKID